MASFGTEYTSQLGQLKGKSGIAFCVWWACYFDIPTVGVRSYLSSFLRLCACYFGLITRTSKNTQIRKLMESLTHIGKTQLAVQTTILMPSQADSSRGFFFCTRTSARNTYGIETLFRLNSVQTLYVCDLLHEVAQHISDHSTTPINLTTLFKEYKRGISLCPVQGSTQCV